MTTDSYLTESLGYCRWNEFTSAPECPVFVAIQIVDFYDTPTMKHDQWLVSASYCTNCIRSLIKGAIFLRKLVAMTRKPYY